MALHKRFDSDDEDAQAENTIKIPHRPLHSSPPRQSEDSDSDGDAAPEAISTAKARGTAKEARQKVTQTRRQAETKERDRRRKLNAERVKQTTGRRRHAEAVEGDNEVDNSQDKTSLDDDQNDDAVANGSSDSTSTPLLPLEVLQAAERQRLKSAAATEVRQARATDRSREPALKRRKHRFTDEGAIKKPATKDVWRGNTRIRVLPELNKTLPPRSTSIGKIAREQWLRGRKRAPNGEDGGGGGSRKAWKSSFAKR